MKDSKLYTIIDALKDNQVILVERQLKEDKRKSLLLLFQLMGNPGAATMEKEVLFYKVFRKKYTAAVDYVLRNEMRLLVEKIESILIKEQVKRLLESDRLFQMKQQLLLYKSLDLFELYSGVWRMAKSTAAEQYQYQYILELNADYYEFVQFHIRNYKERQEIFDKLIDENILFSNYFLAHQYAYTSFLEGNANKLRLEYQLKQEHKIPENNAAIELKQYHSHINEYYKLVGKWFPIQGKGKTDILLEALNSLEQCNMDSAPCKQEYLRVLNLIATDYSMSADFEQANVYFEKIFQEIPASHLHNKAYYLFNYAINLTKLNRYEAALLIIADAEKHIRSSNEFLKEKYHLLKVICYLFTNDAEQLKKMLPTDFSDLLPEQRVYFRFVNTIYHIINKEFDLASEEINNLLRSKLINEIDIHFLIIARFFKNALNLILKENSLQLSAGSYKKIKEEAYMIDLNEPSVVVNYMPYKWLKAALNM